MTNCVRPYGRVLGLACLVSAVLTSHASAQERRMQAGVTLGWTWSDGVERTATDPPGRFGFDAVDPADALSWGARFGYFVARGVEVGFLFDQQGTRLEFSLPTSSFELGDITIRTYHGYLAYHFGAPSARVRPYVLAGLGATHYGAFRPSPAPLLGDLGIDLSIDGATKFSLTTAAGVTFGGPRVGFLFEGRFTPTYLRSTFDGWWCDEDWGCYVVDKPQYAMQFELAGGVVFGF